MAWTSFLRRWMRRSEGGGKEGRKVRLGKTIMCLCVYVLGREREKIGGGERE